MAISAYTGVPGTGKSYALVAEIIVPGVRDGRRVLTNVQGVDPQKVLEYCEAKWPKEAGELGEVILFDGSQTLEPGFFPAEGEPDGDAFVRAGDLIVFDEVRMFWPRRGKFSPAVMKFLRYHRHFVSARTHQSTDVVLASQLVTDFHEDFRGCIERNYKMKKLKAVGLNSRYVWQSWEGSEQRKGHHVGNGGGKYAKDIYNLYSSYAGEKGKEASTDRRTNVIMQPKFLAICAGTLLGLFFSLYWVWGFFHPHSAKPKAEAVAAIAAPASVPTTAVGAAAVPVSNGAPPVSAVWRISGAIQTPGLNVVVLVDRAGNTRYEDPSNFTMVDGRPYVGVVDGQRVLAIGMQSASVPASSPVSFLGNGR